MPRTELYAYCPTIYRGKTRLQHIRDQLEDRIFFRSPVVFPDHLDCRPKMLASPDPLIYSYLNARSERNPGGFWDFADPHGWRIRNLTRFRDQAFLQGVWNKNVHRCMRVLCVTDSFLNGRLWRDFGEEGRGFCIRLNTSLMEFDPVRWVLYRVRYQEAPYSLEPVRFLLDPGCDRSIEAMRSSLSTKLSSYSHEAESRLLLHISANPENEEGILEHGDDGTLVQAPKGTVSALIMGPQVSEADEGEVRSWGFDTPIFRIERGLGRLTRIDR